MAALSKELLADLRETLLSCGPFFSGNALQALFVDARVKPWQNNLPDADSNAGRVDAVISYLIDRRNRQGENALWLLTQVLRDRTHVEDACYDQLADLSQRLKKELSQAAAANAPEPPAPAPNKPVDLVRLHELLAQHFSLDELRTLCFRLNLDIADLPGEGKSAKARELVTYVERRGRTAELIVEAKRERDHVNWDSVYKP